LGGGRHGAGDAYGSGGFAQGQPPGGASRGKKGRLDRWTDKKGGGKNMRAQRDSTRDTLRMRRGRCLWCCISVSPSGDRFGSSSDPSLNGNLHYPNNIDRSLNEATDDKIRKYHADYNNNPPLSVSFMPGIASTSGRLHSEFIRLLFLQAHRETDRFFTASGVQLPQTNSGLFHFLRTVFS
jgi:hypothetical protein